MDTSAARPVEWAKRPAGGSGSAIALRSKTAPSASTSNATRSLGREPIWSRTCFGMVT